jgi:trehalose synthase
MINLIGIKEVIALENYEMHANLVGAVAELHKNANLIIPQLRGRKVWMINSASQGGGVAEMLPSLINILRQVGLEINWGVIGTEEQDFFDLTKKIHNLIHGQGKAYFSEDERRLFEQVNKENAEHLLTMLKPEDIVIVHDPQPIAMVTTLLEKMPLLNCIWQCHIGLEQVIPETESVWNFLKPYLEKYKHSIFTVPEYAPNYLHQNFSTIYPSIDPLSYKNRYLSPTELASVLHNADLALQHHQVIDPPFGHKVKRLQPDGKLSKPALPQPIDLLYTPFVLQISRWDRLKGFKSLLEAFVQLKENSDQFEITSSRHRRILELIHLVLAGPDSSFIKDDPEGQEVFWELSEIYCQLPPNLQKYIAILQLPMDSIEENALIVNALQRCATLVVQNSLREGFGLTVTEAMWKLVPVMGTQAWGIRQQICDGVNGRLINNSESPKRIADVMVDMLSNHKQLEMYALSAQKRVLENFLVFNQARDYLNLLKQEVLN